MLQEESFFPEKLRLLEEMTQQGRQVINLGIGNPDLPPAPEVLSAMQQCMQQPGVHGYQSNKGSADFRRSAAAWYQAFFGVSLEPESQVVPLQGSRQGIVQISQAFLNVGDEVLIPSPAYPTYAFGAYLAGARTRAYPLLPENQFLPDFAQLERMDLSRVRMMWVNYPHMPTGIMASQEVLTRLVDFARRHQIILINDHAYSLVNNPAAISLLSVPGALDVCLELNSLSKNYNLAGWRLAFVAGNAQSIRHLLQLKSHMDSGIALPLQAGASAALQLDLSWFEMLNKSYVVRRKWAERFAQALDCNPCGGSAGMFLWAQLPGRASNSKAFVSELLAQTGIFVAPGSLFGMHGEGFIRISLCAGEQQWIQALKMLEQHQMIMLSN